MRSYQRLGKLLAVVFLSVGLTGCYSLTSNIKNEVNGEISGSSEVVSHGKQLFKVDDFDEIQVKADAMAIYVTKSATDEAEVDLLTNDSSKSRFTLDASIQSGKLNITVKEKGKNINFNDLKGIRKLNISLPEKMYDELKIKNSFGLVEVHDLTLNNVDIHVDAGSIQLDGVVSEMDLEVNSGQIVVEGFELEHDLTAKTDAGEIRINMNKTPKAAEIDLASEVGAVTAKLEGIEYSVDSINKKKGKIGSGGHYIKASTSIGAILVEAKQ